MPRWGEIDDATRWEIAKQYTGKNWQALVEQYSIDNSATARTHALRRRRRLAGAPGIEPAPDALRGITKSYAPTDIQAEVIRRLKRQPQTIIDLANALDCAPKAITAAIEALQGAGYAVIERGAEMKLPDTPPPVVAHVPPMWDRPAGRVTWAMASDLHAGSKAAQKSAFHLFMRIAHEEHGVTHTLVSGDLLAGNRVYKGQEFELYAIGAEEQVDDLVNDYLPRLDGHTYHVIGGNHDFSYYRQASLDVVRQVAMLRADVVHHGWTSADVPLTERADIRMWHPSGGQPYAVSYRGQKYAAQIAQQELLEVVLGEKPSPRVRVVQIGHLHVKAGPIEQGPMDVFQAGCFEWMTDYLKAKGLTPAIGGYIVDAEVTDNGLIRSMGVRSLRFDPIDEDYHGHRQPDPKLTQDVSGSIFSFRETEPAHEW